MNKIITLIFLLLSLGVNAPSFAATTLIDIYREALNSDPIFKQAYSTYMSNKEATPQAAASLLPSLTTTGSLSRTSNQNDPTAFIDGYDTTYNSDTYTLLATQPLFNYQAWMNVQKAQNAVKQAEATFNAAAQDLIIRVAAAYLNVLQAKDTLRFTQAEKRANFRQLEQAEQRYKVGLDAITSVYEAQASYDSTVAQEIADQNNLINQFENLRKLTNRTYPSLADLESRKLPLVSPQPSRVDVWVETALGQNFTLAASKFALAAAKKNIKIAQSGSYPTLDVQGSYTDLDNDDSTERTTTGQTSVASLNLTFPIVQGGLVLSQTRQAKYDYQTAAEQFEETYRETLVNTRTAYNNIIDGINQIKADRQAVKSSQNSVDSTEAQFKVGTRTMVDVLDAQQKLYQAQTQQATDQYNYINAILALKQSAGTLSVADLVEINAWLSQNGDLRVVRHPLYSETTPSGPSVAPNTR